MSRAGRLPPPPLLGDNGFGYDDSAGSSSWTSALSSSPLSQEPYLEFEVFLVSRLRAIGLRSVFLPGDHGLVYDGSAGSAS